MTEEIGPQEGNPLPHATAQFMRIGIPNTVQTKFYQKSIRFLNSLRFFDSANDQRQNNIAQNGLVF